ncbi:hypothetical protein L6R53_18490 [Myxococcota bacterium]|nr:hypothetical protein [Myxococcota bacterium]
MSAAPPFPARPAPPRPAPPRLRRVEAAAARRPGARTGLLLLALGLSACGDPAASAARDYAAAMQPVLVDNMKLTREFVDVAAEVKKGQVDPKVVAGRFEQRLVPGAGILRDQVLAIDPEEEALIPLHQELEQAWSGRAEAWAELHRAWTAGELEAFDQAMRRNLEVKAAEERYFTAVNAWLAPHGQALDAYP